MLIFQISEEHDYMNEKLKEHYLNSKIAFGMPTYTMIAVLPLVLHITFCIFCLIKSIGSIVSNVCLLVVSLLCVLTAVCAIILSKKARRVINDILLFIGVLHFTLMCCDVYLSLSNGSIILMLLFVSLPLPFAVLSVYISERKIINRKPQKTSVSTAVTTVLGLSAFLIVLLYRRYHKNIFDSYIIVAGILIFSYLTFSCVVLLTRKLWFLSNCTIDKE